MRQLDGTVTTPQEMAVDDAFEAPILANSPAHPEFTTVTVNLSDTLQGNPMQARFRALAKTLL